MNATQRQVLTTFSAVLAVLMVWLAGEKMATAQTPSADLLISEPSSDTAAIAPPMGLIAQPSPYSVEETADRLEAVIVENGLNIIARVDHQAGAASVELELRPTQVLIFGNPMAGTPLMQCSQSIAIDLPQKALVWEDRVGQVWLGYNDPQYLADRHGLADCDNAIGQVADALGNLMNAAIEPEAAQF